MTKKRKEEKAHVVVKCTGCKKTRKVYAGEIADDDFPMCDDCYMPMIPTKAVGGRR
jgi:hypothetical protein